MLSFAEWQGDLRKSAIQPTTDTDRIAWLLQAYERQSRPERRTEANNRAERLRLLGELRRCCAQGARLAWTNKPLLGRMVDIGMQCDRQIAAIQKSGGHWATVRRVFAPSGRGPTQTIQHATPHGAPTGKQNYWLELLDPNHRSWGHRDTELFDQWLADAGCTTGFWQWLEDHGHDGTGVEYLAPDQRWKYLVVFEEDRCAYVHNGKERGQGEMPLRRFSTRNMRTHFSGEGFAVWVCSPTGMFYAGSHALGWFHHSSFLAGQRVKAAGEWVFSDGRLLLISHKTGHYRASAQHLLRAMQQLRRRLDLSHTRVLLQDFASPGKGGVVTTAEDFLRSGGVVAACKALSCSEEEVKEEARKCCLSGVDWQGLPNPDPGLFAEEEAPPVELVDNDYDV